MAAEKALRAQLRILRQRLSSQYGKFEALVKDSLNENEELDYDKIDVTSLEIIQENMNDIWGRLYTALEDLIQLQIEAV